MATPVHIPRVNNNDDSVLIVSLDVKERDFVKRGQIVGAVETDKAVVDVQAECDGYVLKVLGQLDENARVGAVLLWLGETADEPVPEQVTSGTAAVGSGRMGRPTAKARALLKELSLSAESIPAAGDRLTVADIEAWLEKQGSRAPTPGPGVGEVAEPTPNVGGEYRDLSPEAHGMLTTVLWHRDQAAPGYLEIEYDPKPWEDYATRYAGQNKLMLSPLLPLMAFRLVELAKATPRINAAIVNGRRYQYAPVNLGFTVQAGETLYLTVIQGAQDMDAARFVQAMGEVQRHAMSHKLRPDELSGATLAFSSMARWNVSRHMPILPPQTGMIVAHAAPRGAGGAVLGASYDHRLLSGFDVVQVLQALAQPPEEP
jgi:pyruvate/2-oxoglutarate dehydrogenase complex dihydrolipoamide acyltransferase (E2) component